MVEAGEGGISRAAALRWLLHDKRGAALVHRVRTHKREDKPMSAYDELTAKAIELRKREPRLTREQAFAKVYEDDRELAKRERIESGFAFDAANTGGAFAELTAKAEELRKREPSLTAAQAFEKVYTDPANVEIAKREREENRPDVNKDWPPMVSYEPMSVGGRDATDSRQQRAGRLSAVDGIGRAATTRR